MGEHPEGLGQRPLREGVGRIALMVDGEGAFEPLVLKVGVEDGHLFGEHHPLVDDRAARQACQIEAGDAGGGRRLFDPAADDVKLAFEGLLVDLLLAADQDLLDLGARRVRLVAEDRHIHRHMAPAVDVVAHPQHFGFDDRAAAFLRPEIGARQKHLPHGDELAHVGFVAGPADLIVEEADRNLDVDARAVAGLAIGIDRAAVPDGLERLDPLFHHPARGSAVDGDHKPHPAGGMLILGPVEGMGVHEGALVFFCPHPGVVKGRHRSAPRIIHGHVLPPAPISPVRPCRPAGRRPSRRSHVWGRPTGSPVRPGG
jgi:hypothetical protein